MDVDILIIGIALLLVSYLVGIKKQTWLLAGFNEKRITNKSLLGTITGLLFFLPLRLIVILNSIIDYAHEGTVLVVAILVMLTSVYVFIKRRLLD